MRSHLAGKLGALPSWGAGRGTRKAMKLINLTDVKGAAVWVNPELLLWVGLPDGVQSNMYGHSSDRASTRLHFARGEHLEVKEALPEVVARLSA